MFKFLLSVLIFCSAFSILGKAQQTDREFAEYYFKNKEYEKAELYFEKLFENQASKYYYTRLLTCYENSQKWEESIDLVKNQIKASNQPNEEYFDLALLYLRVDDRKKADKYIEKGLENIPNNRSLVANIGRKLEAAALYKEAQQLYENAKKGSSYGYNLELANLYGVQGETKQMIRSYIQLVGENPAYLNSVQSALIRYLDFVDDQELSDVLREELLSAVQDNSDKKSLTELLIWFYYQKKDFAPAFAQIRALDLRFSEKGTRVLEFAQLAARNNEYGVAYRAYDYLIESYPEDQIYKQVISQKAKMAYLELQEISVPQPEDLNRVVSAFDFALNTIGKSQATASLMIDYADYTLKYGAGPTSAMALLQEVIDLPNLYNRVVALAKLRLADIQLITGNIWDAALLYGQVDKAFKEDDLGAEAKLRNAKIAFYTGDFEWAQAQLDVLKSSTSELISNDAMDLSLLITNNFNLDTVTEPLELYAAADLAVLQNKFDSANVLLTKLENTYPAHSLSDEVLWVKYKMAIKKREFEIAKTFLEEIIEKYPYDLLGDNALFALANLYLEELGDREKAAELFEKIIQDYPGSLFIIESRKQFRRLRGDAFFEG